MAPAAPQEGPLHLRLFLCLTPICLLHVLCPSQLCAGLAGKGRLRSQRLWAEGLAAV